jgi:hypothetical protein
MEVGIEINSLFRKGHLWEERYLLRYVF